ncbi:hypothetical protein DI09_147p10, partial [Mitosporidium daphniae]
MNGTHSPRQHEGDLLHSIVEEFFRSFFETHPTSNLIHADLLNSCSKFLDYISLIYKGEIFAHAEQINGNQHNEMCDPISLFKYTLLMPSGSAFAGQNALTFIVSSANSQMVLERLSSELTEITWTNLFTYFLAIYCDDNLRPFNVHSSPVFRISQNPDIVYSFFRNVYVLETAKVIVDVELVFSNSTISANVLVIHPQALKEGGLNAGVIGDDEKSFLDSLSHMSSGKFWELFHLISTSFGVGLCKAVFSEPRIITKEVNISFFSNLTLDDQLSLSLIRSIMSSLILNPSTLHHLAKIVTTFPLGFVCEILGHMLGLLSEDASNLWLFLLFAEKINPVPPRDCMAFRNSV